MSTKHQRKALALRLSEIAIKHGATVEIDDSEGPYRPRSVYVNCAFPEVSVSFDVDDLHKGGIMAHWHGAKRPLQNLHIGVGFSAFDSVNPHHKCKATTYRPDAESYAQWFEQACAAVERGDVFES